MSRSEKKQGVARLIPLALGLAVWGLCEWHAGAVPITYDWVQLYGPNNTSSGTMTLEASTGKLESYSFTLNSVNFTHLTPSPSFIHILANGNALIAGYENEQGPAWMAALNAVHGEDGVYGFTAVVHSPMRSGPVLLVSGDWIPAVPEIAMRFVSLALLVPLLGAFKRFRRGCLAGGLH
ncbi:hypothetical protein SBV1_1980007 [Verrucomicrobia bacterium]|nr:hypothetical protein SBV1_1980007 [Verrucomicrobiota bacterium]